MHIRTTFTFAAATLGLGALSTALAGPTGGVVVEGQGSISSPSATTTVIDQASQNLNLNWNTFNVAANENVQFRQPDSSSVAFNRILDQNPSQIFGRIDANGKVVLVNPNGLLIGRTAQLNTNSLVVSSLDAIDFDATSGRYRFSTNRLDPGAVINEGSITAGPGGSVTLLGGRVSNVGSIVADYGTVNLAAGRAATLDLAGDGLLRLEVGADLLSNGSGAVAAVDNSGSIQANGGHVLLTANAVRDVFANLINNSGVVRANRIDNSGGTIKLLGPEGTVLSSGTLDASAGDVASTGGSVAMLGERVGLMDNAVVDVSGTTGGGTALIGGDYQGKNPNVLNAQRTFVSTGTTINADAGNTGDGGRVIVWADDITRFGGNISARGGLAGGDGGFAEVSGKQSLEFAGAVDMTAAQGTRGELLLDPDDIEIVAGAGDPDINPTTGVLAFADVTTQDPAQIGAAAISTLLATTDVTLQAEDSITQLADVLGPVSARNLTLQSNGTMLLTNITLQGGSINASADSTLTLGGRLQTNNDAVTARSINGTLSLSPGAVIDTNGGAVNLRARNLLTLRGTVDTSGGLVTVRSDIGAITMTAGSGSSINSNGGAVTLDAPGNITLTSIDAGGGTVDIESAAGDILNDGTTATFVRGGNVSLQANLASHSVGSSGAGAIDTDASNLSASAANGVFIREQDDVTVSNVDGNSGAVSINALGPITVSGTVEVNGGSSAITLNSTGFGSAITMQGGSTVTTNGGNGTITLGSTGNIIVDTVQTAGQVSINANGANINDVDGNSRTEASLLTLRGANIGDSGAFDIDVTSLDAEAGNRLAIVDHGFSGLTLNNLQAGVAGATVTADGAIGFGPAAQIRNVAGGALSIRSVNNTLTMSPDTQIDAGSGAVSLRGQGNVTVGNVRAVGGSVSVTSDFSNIVGLSGRLIETDALTLTASSGSIGVPGTEIETKVASLGATANTGVFIEEQDGGLTLDTITAGVGGFTLTAPGEIRVDATKIVSTSGAPIQITSSAGAITMENGSEIRSGTANTTLSAQGNVTVARITTTGAGDVSITSASGNIVDDGVANTVIQADQVTLSANAGQIGASATNQDIDTNAVDLAVSAAHGAWIRDTGSVNVTQLAAGDTATVVTAQNDLILAAGVAATSSNAPITLRSTAGMFAMDTGSSINAGSGTVTIAADGTVALRDITTTGDASITSTTGDISNDPGTLIKAAALTLSASGGQIGFAGAGNEIDTDVTSLTATALNGMYVGEANGIALDDIDGGNAEVTVAANGAVSVVAGKTVQANNAPISITTTSGGLSMGNASTIDAGNGLVTLSAPGDVRVSRIITTGNASITSTGANILDDTTANTVVQANVLTLSAASGRIGDAATAGEAIDTDANSLSATAAHGAWISDVGAVAVTHLDAGNAAAVMTAQNALSLANAATVSTVNAPITLTSTAGTFSMGNGSVIDAGNGEIALAANGAVSLRDVWTTGDASVTSTTSNILNAAGTVIRANSLTLTATAGVIGLGGAGLELDTDVAALTATAGHGIVLGEANAITLADVNAGDGGLTLTAGQGITLDDGFTLTATATGPVSLTSTIGSIFMGTGSAIVAGSGAVSLNALTDIGVTDITTTGAASLTSLAGSILDDGVQGTLIRAGALTLSANFGTIGGAAADADIDTRVSSLDATGTSVYIHETDGLQLNAITATTGDLTVKSDAGNIATAGTLQAANQVTLNATTGAITDDDNDVTRIIGGDITLTAGTGIGTVDLNAASSGYGSSLDVFTNGDLKASVTSNTGQINLNIDQSSIPTLATGAITVGSGTGRGGAVILQSFGDLDVAGLQPGAINIGAGNTTTVGLVSGGTLTLPSAGGFTDAPADTLFVRGAVDVKDDDTDAHNISLAANTLNFQSGGFGGATLLNTSANRLDATLGNNQNLTIAEADGITLGTVSAGNANLVISAGGAIADDGNATTRLTASNITLTGTALGAGGNELGTDALTVNATASAGGIFVREVDDLQLTAHATGGAVDVRAANGALTVTGATGTGVTLASGSSSVSLIGAVDAGTGPVNVTAGGANGAINIASTVSTTGDATFTSGTLGALVLSGADKISARNLSITAASIGNGSQRLNTAVDSLTATASNGAIYVNEDDALLLNVTAANGPVDVRTTNGSLTVSQASGGGVSLVAGGNGNALHLNGLVQGGTGDVLLMASGAGGNVNINDTVRTTGNVILAAGLPTAAGAITSSNNGRVEGNQLIINTGSVGASGAQLNTAVNGLMAVATNGGIYVQDADALNVTAAAIGPVQVSTIDGALNVASVNGEGVTLSAGGANGDLTVSGAANGGTGSLVLSAGNAMTLDGPVGAAGSVTLTTNGAGSALTINSIVQGDQLTITAGPANARGAIVVGQAAQLGANNATLRASAIGADTARLNTSFGSLDAQASNGGIFVSEADSLALNAAATNGSVDVSSLGDVTVGSVTATGDVVLSTAGAIVGATNNNVAGTNVYLAGSSVGSSAARVNTTATSLELETTNGGAFINEADGVTLLADVSGGALDVTAGGALTVDSVTGEGVALTTTGAGANILVNGAIDAGVGSLALAANGAGSGIALNAGLSTSGAATLTAGSAANRGAITVGAGAQITAASLTATGSSIGSSTARLNTTVGSLTATSTNGGTFVTETDALTLTGSASGGALDVRSGGALTVTSATGAGVTLATTGAGAGITVNGALSSSGEVSLTAGTVASRGAISAGAGNQVTGTTLTATGSSIGSASNALNTSIDTLNASASTGDVYVREQNGIRLADVRAGSKIDIGAANGNVTVNTVNASGDASLAAGNGAILDDGDDSTRLTGVGVTLSARSIGAASTLAGGTLDSKPRLDIDATRLDATSTAGGIFIDSRNGLSSVSLRAIGGADGDIELLTANGDLNLQSVNASDSLLLAAARNIYGLPSLGSITARAAELRAGGANASEGHIGTLSQPLSLQLSPGNTLRIFVPQTVDPNDASRAPSTLPSAGVTSTLSLFSAPSALSLQAGFGQFSSLSDTQFTSPAEALVRSIQNQTATVQSVLGLDWASFDPNVSLFGTLDPSVCLPGDQRDEEEASPGC